MDKPSPGVGQDASMHAGRLELDKVPSQDLQGFWSCFRGMHASFTLVSWVKTAKVFDFLASVADRDVEALVKLSSVSNAKSWSLFAFCFWRCFCNWSKMDMFWMANGSVRKCINLLLRYIPSPGWDFHPQHVEILLVALWWWFPSR